MPQTDPSELRSCQDQTVAPRVFIEMNPFHAVTLYPYHANCSTGPDDVVFANKRLFGEPFFDEIVAKKRRFSLLGVIGFILRNRVKYCHFNTIDVTLNPLVWETIKVNILLIILPMITRLLGCKNSCIMHQAHLYYPGKKETSRRDSLYRRLMGRMLIRFFSERFVLSQDVARYLKTLGTCVKVLDCRPLSRFQASSSGIKPAMLSSSKVVLCSIGPVVSVRRNWTLLANLDPMPLEDLSVLIVMLCDSRIGEGLEFKKTLAERGLDRYFLFFDYRPDDYELCNWVRASSGILCLSNGPAYGATMVSGARIFADAFQKSYIDAVPSLGVYRPDGALLAEFPSLNHCIARVAQDVSTLNMCN